ncbi:MAG TPA: hypothetical protein VMA75_02130 [Candidatus Paceibacterota bacterium]|nr:hypothetical protein [Candidatus Paceibacterota bacterium]
MDTSPNFENALEADMKTLAAEIKRAQELKDVKNAAGVEVVKEAIRAFPQLERSSSNGVPTPPTPGGAGAPTDTNPLPAYAQSAPPEVKLEIEYLIDVALHKGIATALTESQKSPYFVQDAFHDALAGKLYPELQRRGVVQ